MKNDDMENAEFGLVESFDIDNGELDGLTPQNCFVLGFELAQIIALARHPGGSQRPVHLANKARIEKHLRKAPRQFKLEYMPDGSETWAWLALEPISGEQDGVPVVFESPQIVVTVRDQAVADRAQVGAVVPLPSRTGVCILQSIRELYDDTGKYWELTLKQELGS